MIHHKGSAALCSNVWARPLIPVNGFRTKILGAALEVHKQVGPGLLESAYDACLCRQLTLRGIPYQRQVPLPLHYHGIPLECGYRLDLVVGELIVGSKVRHQILPIHRAQLITYLKLLQLRIGFVINFNVSVLRLVICRVIQD